ncbi:MAG TPA: hypothetical protein VJ867_09440, partial [Gemmatimonadaceae bacterium]|nr:hypothetical protein [Gemmatimonadaceae bacterium]
GVLLFSGTVQVIAKVGADPTQLPPVLPLSYVGPGYEATRVRISPRDTTIAAGAHLALTATAFDASDAAVTDPTFVSNLSWRVLESALGTITANSSGGGDFVGAGTRGVAHVRVGTLNLHADTIALNLVPPATQVVVISGDAQSANAGTALPQPVVVEVRASDNLPVPNTVVRFTALNGGSASPDSTMTNVQGRAQTTLTLGSASGTQSFQATVAGITPATISATAINPNTATTLVLVSGDGQSANVGQALGQPFVVELQDQFGQPFVGATVTFSAVTGGGSVGTSSTTTDSQGRAQTSLTLGTSGGAQTFRASVPGITPVTITATAIIPPGSIKFAKYANLLDVGATASAPATVKALDGSVIDTARVNYASRNGAIATVSAGTITGVAAGQATIVGTVARATSLKDSTLAIVVPTGGVVLMSSIDRFEYPTDTTMTVSIFVDLRSSGKNLGSTTIDVTWSTSQLLYQSWSNGSSGVVPTVNATGASSGTLTLAMADVNGFGGKVEMLRVTFKTATTAATGALTLTAREMTASDVTTNLLPLLVQVKNSLSVH